MSSSSAVRRDGGVSDILKMTEDLELTGAVRSDDIEELESTESTPDVDKIQEPECSKLRDDQNEEQKSSSFDSGIIDDVQKRKTCRNTDIDGAEGVPSHIDFGDPEQVINLLETVDLSEEDTEYLLQETYSMNKKLKEILRRQEGEGESNDQTQKHREKHTKPRNEDIPTSGSRQGSSFGARKPLPPISCDRETTGIYTMKLRRARTNIPSQSFLHHQTEPVQRSKSSKAPGRDTGDHKPKSKTKDSKSEAKPDWNSRWSYT